MTIPTFYELYNSLPEQYHNNRIENDLLEKYNYLVSWMDKEAARAKSPRIELSKFRDSGGYQIICEGSVSDDAIPYRNSYNWHLQNTSQWLFAFGLVFDKQRLDFSIHT